MSKLFEIFAIKSLMLKNRIVMPPMCMYSAGSDGKVTPWHFVHYSSRAVGNAALIIQEATSVEKRGRLSDNDLGIWSDVHIDGLSKLVDSVHYLGSKICIQIAHGGRKAWTGGEAIIAPSAIRFSENSEVPRELDSADIESIVNNFQTAAERAVKAGYDAIEIHAAHGYLIHQFISPYSNKRNDNYGGSKSNCLRFPVEIIKAVKSVMPEDMPLFMRISAVEYLEDGYSLDDMIEAIKVFREHGLDVIDVSSGGASPVPPKSFPGFQLPYAQRIKNETGLPTIGCGLITQSLMAEKAIADGKADLVAIGRGILANPYWPLTAARELEVSGFIPKQYKMAYPESIR